MKVTNTTHYRTEDLRRLAAAALKAEGLKQRRYLVEFVPGRTNYVRGWGYYYRRHIRIMIPTMHLCRNEAAGRCRREKRPCFEDVTQVAQVIVHELGHNRGLHHDEMRTLTHLDVAWCSGMSIRAKAAKPKQQRDIMAERSAHATEMLEKWTKKRKAAETREKHWRGKVRYYERALAAREEKRAAAPTMGGDA